MRGASSQEGRGITEADIVENIGPFAIGTGIGTLAISAPFMAVAVGLIEADEPIHWALRVVLFLFCAPFVLIGAALVGGGFIHLVNTTIPGDAAFVVRAPRYLFYQASRPRHLLAAIPLAFLLVQYAVVARTGHGFFGVSTELLARGIMLEFIAIHATGFLGAATFIPTTGRLWMARYGVFAGLGILYMLMATAEGSDAALLLAYLVAVKLGPLILAPPDLYNSTSLFLRWGFGMVVFLSVFTLFGGFESFRAGAIYWSVITVAELLGMTEAELLKKKAGDQPG